MLFFLTDMLKLYPSLSSDAEVQQLCFPSVSLDRSFGGALSCCRACLEDISRLVRLCKFHDDAPFESACYGHPLIIF